MKRRHLILLGLLAFLYAALMQAPAAALYAWFKPERLPADIDLQGIAGTVGEGRIAAVTVGERPVVQGLTWQFQPLELLRLRAAFDLESEATSTLVQGRAALGVTGNLRLRDFRIAATVDKLVQAAGFPFLAVNGQARLELAEFRVKDGFPAAATGTLDLHQLAWALAREPIVLGDYHAEIVTEGSDIIARVNSVAGPLDLSGDLRLGNDGSYAIDLQFRAKDDAPPMVREFVRTRGTADTRGYHHLRQQGTLPRS